MIGLGRGANQPAANVWRDLPFGYKFMAVTCLITTILGLFTSLFIYLFVNDLSLTLESFQVWRLFTSWMVLGKGLNSIITFLFVSLMLYSILPEIECKHSTAFLITQLFLQNLLVNAVFSLLMYPLFLIEVVSQSSLIAYGCYPFVMVFIWRGVKADPDGQSQFCFFPCLIPNKYIPFCFLLTFFIFGGPFWLNSVAFLLGYIQFFLLDETLIKLPLSYYRKIDALLPRFIIERPDYVKVNKTEAALLRECGCCWKSKEASSAHTAPRNAEDHFANPFQPQQPIPSDKVDLFGRGVAIGGQAPQRPLDYKQHWANYDHEKKQEEEAKQAKQAKQVRQVKQQKEKEEKEVQMGNESMMTQKSLFHEEQLCVQEIPSVSPGEIGTK